MLSPEPSCIVNCDCTMFRGCRVKGSPFLRQPTLAMIWCWGYATLATAHTVVFVFGSDLGQGRLQVPKPFSKAAQLKLSACLCICGIAMSLTKTDILACSPFGFLRLSNSHEFYAVDKVPFSLGSLAQTCFDSSPYQAWLVLTRLDFRALVSALYIERFR